MEILHRSIVGADDHFVPGVNQARRIENRANIRLSVFIVEQAKPAQFRYPAAPAPFDAQKLLLMHLLHARAFEPGFSAVEQRQAVIDQIKTVDGRQPPPG